MGTPRSLQHRRSFPLPGCPLPCPPPSSLLGGFSFKGASILGISWLHATHLPTCPDVHGLSLHKAVGVCGRPRKPGPCPALPGLKPQSTSHGSCDLVKPLTLSVLQVPPLPNGDDNGIVPVHRKALSSVPATE